MRFEFPWSEEEFIRCLRQRNCIGMVAEHGERVVGFMIYELHKTRLHILNFAVADGCPPPRHRPADDREADRQALEPAPHADFARSARNQSCRLNSSSAPAAFKATSVLHEFYDDSPEDAYLMQYLLPAGRGGDDPADESDRSDGGVKRSRARR